MVFLIRICYNADNEIFSLRLLSNRGNPNVLVLLHTTELKPEKTENCFSYYKRIMLSRTQYLISKVRTILSHKKRFQWYQLDLALGTPRYFAFPSIAQYAIPILKRTICRSSNKVFETLNFALLSLSQVLSFNLPLL